MAWLMTRRRFPRSGRRIVRENPPDRSVGRPDSAGGEFNVTATRSRIQRNRHVTNALRGEQGRRALDECCGRASCGSSEGPATDV